MTTDLLRPPRRLAVLEVMVGRARSSRTALTEEELLTELWHVGEDVRLHEDERFVRSSHSHRWLLREQRLANDTLYRELLTGDWDGRDLDRALVGLDRRRDGTHVFDPDDARFHQVCDRRWTAVLEELPLLSAPTPDAADVLSLEAAGGRLDGSQAVEPDGWVALREAPPPGAFVARVVGASMEPLLPDRSWALFVPDGGKGKVVLAVHPEFRDGGLVACTVKNAVRDAQGNLTDLRAENEVFRSQPVLPGGALWEDVRPVASLVRPLNPTDFVDLVIPGARGLARGPLSEADVQRRLEGLRRRLDTLLRPRTPRPSPSDSQPPTADAWAAPELVLAVDGRSLRVWIPGWPLPDSARQVTVAGVRMVARNLRREQLTPSVRAQADPYAFQTDAPADVQDRLRAFTIPGLALDRASVFGAPAQGPGLRLRDDVPLRDGKPYRLLVPAALRAAADALRNRPWVEELGRLDGWTVLHVEVPAEPDGELDGLLGTLRLTRSVVGLELALVGPGPRRQGRLASGLDAPVYCSDDPPCVRITAAEPCDSGEVHVLVVDALGSSRLALGPGSSWTIELAELAPGAVLVEARATDRDVEHDQLVFLIEATGAAPEAVPAEARLELGARCIPLAASTAEVMDLRPLLADGQDAVARIVGPPLWRYRVAWGTDHLGSALDASADEDGVAALPLPELRSLTAARALAQVAFEGAELGNVRLLHDAPPTTDELLRALRDLNTGRAVPIRSFAGAHELAREWIIPVLRCVGFEPGLPLASGDLVQVPLARLRPADGGVFREDVGLARVIRPGGDTLAGLDAAAYRDPLSPVGQLAQELRRSRLSLGILTDGERWVRLEPLRFVPRIRTVDLRAALADAFDHRLAEFLDVLLD